MPAAIKDIETLARQRLLETTPRFWTSDELTQIIIAGIKDLWRDIVDLKQEHYLTINVQDVFYDSNSDRLRGVPGDVHKVFEVEPLHAGENDPNNGLIFTPLDYNHKSFQFSRALAAMSPSNATVYYAITGQGAPVGPPLIYCAPMVTASVAIRFCYVPTLPTMDTNYIVPVPGESTNALVAWTVAFARAKETDARIPDASWLAIYATEKQHLLQSLGLRQYQEPSYSQAEFEEYWG